MLESPKIGRTVSEPIFFVIVSDPEVALISKSLDLAKKCNISGSQDGWNDA